MRISGWRIDGFGIFADTKVDDVPPGLTLVTGPNEAGKSTLLAFLRGVLFGYPDGRTRARRYEPVNGGKHGGAVFLTDSDGETWTVERHLDPKSFSLRRPDGSTGEPGELTQLLGGADATLFANVFAFGLTELDEFEFIDSDAVRDRIFSAGVVGAGRSAREALAALDSRRTALVRPRGRCEVRDLADELRQITRQLNQARLAAGDLVHRQAEVERLAGVAEKWRSEADRCREEQQRLRALIEVWPVRSRISDIELELTGLDLPATLDDTVEGRFERAFAERAGAQRGLEEAEVAAAAARKRRDAIDVDERLVPIVADVRAMVGELALEEGRRTRVSELERAIATQNELLAQQLASLGPEWDRGHLAGFDASIPAADEVRQRGMRLDDLERRVERLSDERVAAAKLRTEAQAGLAAIQTHEERSEPLPSAEDAARAARALRQLRAHLVELGTESARLEASTRSLSGLRVVAPAARTAGAGSRLAAVLFGSSGLLLCALALAALVGNAPQLAAPLGVVGALSLMAAAASFFYSRASTKDTSEEAVNRQLVEAEEATRAARDRVEMLRTSVRATALQLGLAPEPSAIDVEECAARIEKESQELREAFQRRAQAADLNNQIQSTTRQMDELEAQVKAVTAELERERGEWSQWKADREVPADMGIEAINDLFTAIERSRTTLRSLQSIERELAEVRGDADAWCERARSLIESAGIGLPDDAVDLVPRVRALSERVESQEAARHSYEERENALVEAEHRVEQSKGRLEQAEGEWSTLLGQAGVSDEAGFRRLLERHRHRLELENERAQALERIHATLGRGEAAEPLLAELERGDRAGWDNSLAEATARLRELESAHEDAIRQHHDAARSLDELSHSGDVADASLRLEAARARLSERVVEWQSLTAARSLITETLARYERERQPAVIARAEQMFEQVTAGHYPKLMISDGEVRVVDRRSRQLATVDLSRGTAEQLYLCVRFGLAAEFASHTPLPFVMDDVLVNSDPERTSTMAAVIGELADSHQVLLFSCQPSSVQTMLETRPDARVIELPRHGEAKPARARRRPTTKRAAAAKVEETGAATDEAAGGPDDMS